MHGSVSRQAATRTSRDRSAGAFGGNSTLQLVGHGLLVSVVLMTRLGVAYPGESSPDLRSQTHPAVIEIGKPAYNLYAAVRAVLADKSLPDACRLIVQTDPEEASGVLPDLRQDGLFLSYPLWVVRLLQEHPAALEFMRQEYRSLGALRLRTAVEEQDAAAAEAVAIRFCGTEAATTAYRWLGDRALAAGDSARALGCYRRAQWWTPTTERQPLDQRLRVATAMFGREVGPPLPGEFEYHGAQFQASEFEKVVREIRERYGELPEPVAGRLTPELPTASAPTAWKARLWAKIEFPPSGTPDVRQADADIDWPAREITSAAMGEVLLLSSRSQLSAVTEKYGKPLWTQSFDGVRGSPWRAITMWTPFSPLAVANRIFVRRLSALGPPALVCLERSKGKVLWTSDARCYVASDAWLSDRSILAITMEVYPTGLDPRGSEPRVLWRPDKKMNRNLLLQLTAIAPDSGQVIAQYPIARFHTTGEPLPSCRVTVTDDRVFATVGGLTFCTDTAGRLQWLRKHDWTRPEREERRPRQHHGSPLVVAERATVCQPGVPTVQCLDASTGALIWEQDAQDLRRLVGAVRGRIVVQTEDGFRGLDSETGTVVWQQQVKHACEVLGCGEPGGLVYAAQESLDADTERWAWVWLDPSDGRVTSRWPVDDTLLPDSRGAAPRLGPLIQTQSKLLVGCDRGGRDRQHREIYELSPISEPEPK